MYFTGLRFGSIFVRFAQQLGEVEVAAGFLDDRSGDLAAAQDGVQALLHRPPDGRRGNAVLLVVLHLLGPPVIADRDEGLHALRDGVGE